MSPTPARVCSGNPQSSGSGNRMTLPYYGFTQGPLRVTTIPLTSLTVPPPQLGLCFLLMLVPDSKEMVGNMTSNDIQLPQYIICTSVTDRATVDPHLTRTLAPCDMETFCLVSTSVEVGSILHLWSPPLTMGSSTQLPFDTRPLLCDSGNRHEFMINCNRDQEVCLRLPRFPTLPPNGVQKTVGHFFSETSHVILAPWHAEDIQCSTQEAQYFDFENHCIKSPHASSKQKDSEDIQG